MILPAEKYFERLFRSRYSCMRAMQGCMISSSFLGLAPSIISNKISTIPPLPNGIAVK